MWNLGPAPAPAGRSPARIAAVASRPTVAATSGRGSTAPVAYSVDGLLEPSRCGQHTHGCDVLDRQVSGVDEAGLARDADQYDAPPGFHEVHGERGGVLGVGGVDDGAEGVGAVESSPGWSCG